MTGYLMLLIIGRKQFRFALNTLGSRDTSRERRLGRSPRLRTRRHRQEHTPTNTKKGWRFATESSWTLWHTGGSQQGHPPYTTASTEEVRGWPKVSSAVRPTTNDNKTKTSLESNVLSQPGAVRHWESYMVAEQRDDHMADESKWRRPRSSRRSRRETEPIIQEKINHVTKHTKRNETTHIKITQNQYTDKVVDVSVERQGQDPPIQTTHRKSWRRKPNKWIWVGPPIR